MQIIIAYGIGFWALYYLFRRIVTKNIPKDPDQIEELMSKRN